MKKQYFLLIFTVLSLCCCKVSFAQLTVGGDGFLQGAYLEIGEQTNGALGAQNPPAGYHMFCSICWPLYGTTATALAETYDYGHDGWAVGSPPMMGDYTLPGSPFEGWEIQMNGNRAQMYQSGSSGSSTTGGSTMASLGLSGYSNVGGTIKFNWDGTYTSGGASLVINMETRVDTYASAVVFTVVMHNTSAVAANGVYYWRSCDPDNDEQWPGGGFATNNVINAQNDIDHRVEVTATGTSPTLPPLSLATKDCRAVAVIYEDWGLTSGQDLAAVWSEAYGPAGSGAFYDVGVDHYNDIAIGIVWNISTIAPGDSAVISYAYVFNGPNGIDFPGAHADPQLVVDGDTITNAPVPDPTYDTFNTCSYPGLLTIPVTIAYSTDKDWTWSKWTWTPSTGLSATTGVSVTIDITALTGPTTYTITGNDSAFCNHTVFILTVIPCHTAHSNAPCEGDTLYVGDRGDSLGATYAWTGPGGFTSTLQNFYFFPATLSDSGMYRVIKTIAGVHDTDSTRAIIHPLPTVLVGSNSPLCAGLEDTLELSVTPLTPGETFSWTGPNGFTSALEFPVVYGNPDSTGLGGIGLGKYTVVATTSFGCIDSANTIVDSITRPAAPVITDPNYCQFQAFVNYTTIPAASPTIAILWYTSATGGTASGTYTPINTAIPGYDTIWATQKIGSCESPRGRDVVKVTVTPPAPVVTGSQYCQYIGPIVDLSPTHTPTGVIWWYGAVTGGDSTLIEPLPNINVAGAYPYYVGQTDSSCPSLRTEVTITIHPKPDTPLVTITDYCQFRTPYAVIATPSGAGDALLWYGPGVTVGTPTPPVPQTDTPGVTNYYVTETSSFGCVSDSSLDAVHVTVKPQPPLVMDIKYCQLAQSVPPLNGSVDSAGSSTLNWYYNTIPLAGAPIPPTDTTPGNYTWYVAQTILQCESDSVPITVTIIYKPVFQIAASQPYVCQFDSITLSYMGPGLFAPGYAWTLPEGAYFADGTYSYDSTVIIKFDTATLNNYVQLSASDDSGFCTSDTAIRIKIVVQPIAIPQTKPDVCLGDTVALSMSGSSSDAYTYTWLIDNVLMNQSLALSVLASNSNSGGPFSISWLDSGRHVIVIESFSQEGCRSLPWYDTINVHTVPDAGFKITTKEPLCLEDSVLFTANETGYNYSYQWSPAHSFNNVNSSTEWGKVEQEQSIITLTVTDPFGCVATSNMEIDPATCCIVSFPNAFTPNGDHDNDFFRPITSGYHKFHVFRVANRWGQTVFESSDDTPQWDGNYNGVPQDMGTYFYYLKYDCGGKTLEQKGDVTLIR